MKERLKKLLGYELFIIIGTIMILGTLIKIFGDVTFSSDWFWLLAGISLILKGRISWKKQKEFDEKYKMIKKKRK